MSPNELSHYTKDRLPSDPVVVEENDPRYDYLVNRGINARFTGQARRILLAKSNGDIESTLAEAAASGHNVKIRAGGHCFDALVDVPETGLLIDISGLTGVAYDLDHRAFKIAAGTTLGQMYRDLFLGWGLTIPAGRCPTVAVGGHVMGGGGGALSRRAGLSVDYLYAIELIVVDSDGQPRTVTATRNPGDPHHDLWWAHTGGGGGIGVVTNYYFKSPHNDALLAQPPIQFRRFSIQWPWSDLSQTEFTRLVSNYLEWLAAHQSPDASDLDLDTSLTLPRTGGGNITLEVSLSEPSTSPDVTEEFVRSVLTGVNAGTRSDSTTVPYLTAMLQPDEYDGVKGRFKAKSAFLKHPLTEQQISHIHDYLTRTDYQNPAAMLHLSSFGGQINRTPTADTAMPHRDTAAKMYWSCFWWDPRDDDEHLTWLADFYTGLFADAGGRPSPQSGYGGAFINYPDLDLTETASVPESNWSTIYFRDNASRLAAVKNLYDPLNIFGHALTPGQSLR